MQYNGSTFKTREFSCSVPDVVIDVQGTRLHVVITFGGQQLYEENLYPDLSKQVTISGLPELIQPLARKLNVADLLVEFTEQEVTTAEDGSQTVTDEGEGEVSCSVIYSAVDVDMDAVSFCDKHFLSRLQGTKVTAIGRYELLHYASGTEQATVTAYYHDGSSQLFDAYALGGNDNYTTLDVSPARFVVDTRRLAYYDVVAGNRRQRYRIDFHNPETAPILAFENSFGCAEVAYCTGTCKQSPSFKYSSIVINGKMRNYDIKEERIYKADTGILTEAMADWMNDLFRSDRIREIYFEDGVPLYGNDIVITEASPEWGNRDDEMPRFSFSYRYAKDNQNNMHINKAARVFDGTFDSSYE